MRVAVFFGGKSCEHNISLITGVQAMRGLAGRHTVIPVLIGQDGVFWTGKDLTEISAFKKGAKVHKKRVVLHPASKKLYTEKGKAVAEIDAAVLATHGFGGEDGCLQGLLTLAGIPFTGAGVAASAIGMNKILMKKIFEREFLPVLPYVGITAAEYKNDLFSVVERVKNTLRFPMIVKPASLGSSIGISVARDFPALFEAIAACFEWDNAVVIENALEGFTELNCAALGYGSEVVTSEIEQPVSSKDFLSFEDKYVSKGKCSKRVFPADIPEELAEKVKSLCKRAFGAVGAAGVARVDFLYDGEFLFVNEINTIPGALSHYLFTEPPVKLSFPDLLDKLLDIAVKIKKEADGLKYIYESSYELNARK